MAIDAWQIQVKPDRRIKQDITSLRNGTESNLTILNKKIDNLQEQVTTLVKVINELVSILKDEVKKPIRKKQLPQPPIPPGIF